MKQWFGFRHMPNLVDDPPPSYKNVACFKSGLKWSKNNHLIALTKIKTKFLLHLGCFLLKQFHLLYHSLTFLLFSILKLNFNQYLVIKNTLSFLLVFRNRTEAILWYKTMLNKIIQKVSKRERKNRNSFPRSDCKFQIGRILSLTWLIGTDNGTKKWIK